MYAQAAEVVKASVVAQVTIAAKPGEIFNYLSDLKYHYLWNPHLESVEPLKLLKFGSQYKTVSLVLGIKVGAENTVSKFAKNQELEVANNTGILCFTVNYQLRSAGRKTRVVCRTAVSTKSKAFAFAKPVLEALARRELQGDLQALKIAVEHHLE